MTSELKVSVDDGDIVTATVKGEVDSSNAAILRARLIDAVENYSAGLVIDMTETFYLDSSGIQVLFDIAGRLNSRGQKLHLVIPEESFLADVAGAVGLRSVATLHTALEPAVAACIAG